MHAYLEVAVFQTAARNGIVEILGIFGVDGKSRHGAAVKARRDFFLAYGRIDCVRVSGNVG